MSLSTIKVFTKFSVSLIRKHKPIITILNFAQKAKYIDFSSTSASSAGKQEGDKSSKPPSSSKWIITGVGLAAVATFGLTLRKLKASPPKDQDQETGDLQFDLSLGAESCFVIKDELDKFCSEKVKVLKTYHDNGTEKETIRNKKETIFQDYAICDINNQKVKIESIEGQYEPVYKAFTEKRTQWMPISHYKVFVQNSSFEKESKSHPTTTLHFKKKGDFDDTERDYFSLVKEHKDVKEKIKRDSPEEADKIYIGNIGDITCIARTVSTFKDHDNSIAPTLEVINKDKKLKMRYLKKLC